MATAIAICGASSVSAADGWMQETEMNAGDHSLTMVLWEDTYDSLVEAMSASDITIFEDTGETLIGTDSVGNRTTYYILDSVDIDLNADTSHSSTASFWKSISCHEMGHAVGVPHIEANWLGEPKAIMNPYYTDFYDDWGLTTPQEADVEELIEKYESVF